MLDDFKKDEFVPEQRVQEVDEEDVEEEVSDEGEMQSSRVELDDSDIPPIYRKLMQNRK